MTPAEQTKLLKAAKWTVARATLRGNTELAREARWAFRGHQAGLQPGTGAPRRPPSARGGYGFYEEREEPTVTARLEIIAAYNAAQAEGLMT